MEPMSAFEQQLSRVASEVAGPARPVDAMAVVRSAQAGPVGRWSVRFRGSLVVRPPRRKRGLSVFSAVKLVAAGVIVALIGGFLFASLATPPVEDTLPAAAPSGPGTFSPAGSLAQGRVEHTATLLPGRPRPRDRRDGLG